jgi:CRISPR/Cas system endoribonuclease Cas6 (RAMP superfamily)
VTTGPMPYARLRVVLDGGPQPWAVPVDYYRLLRAAVYNLLRTTDASLAEFLHRDGFSEQRPAIDFPGSRNLSAAEGRTADTFKLFCFSSLIGDGALQQGRLVFDKPVVWFFVTPLPFLAEGILAALRRSGTLRVGRVDLRTTVLEMLDAPPIQTTLTGVLLSPLVVSVSLPADARSGPGDVVDAGATGSELPSRAGRQRHYLTREDSITLMEARLRSNLLAKHRAVYGVEPEDPAFGFLWTAASPLWPAADRSTRLVRLSGRGGPPVRVRGNLGAVTLAGTPELLRLALHTGLGQYNASGMGFLLPATEAQMLQV